MLCNKCKQDLEITQFEIRDWKWNRRKTCKTCRNYKTKKQRQNQLPNQQEHRKRYKKDYNKTPHWIFIKRCDIRLCVARRRFWKDNIISDWTIKAQSFYDIFKKQKGLCALNKKLKLKNDEWEYIYIIDHITPFARWWHHTISNIRLIHPDTDRLLNYRTQ